MNIRTLALTGVVSLGIASLAGAATNYVYLTGSTACRGTVFNTITNAGVVFTAQPAIITQGNANNTKGDYMSFYGTRVGDSSGDTTAIKCHWSGSEAGIADVANTNSAARPQFLDDTAANNNSDVGPFVNAFGDLAMADNDKQFSKNPGANITGVKCGIITFRFVREKGSNTNIVGVTDEQMRALLSGGSVEALLTGNNTDTNFCYITGRDSFSGTRVNTYGTTGYGIFSAAFQIEVASDGTMIKLGTNGDFTDFIGDYGYSSGGSVATQMGTDLGQSTSYDVIQALVNSVTNHFSVVGYLGFNDASTATNNGGVELTYNGLMESTALVQQGKYTFWGKEFIYHRNVNPSLSSQASAVYTLLSTPSTGINHNADGKNLIDYTTMHADRNGPTSDPFHF